MNLTEFSASAQNFMIALLLISGDDFSLLYLMSYLDILTNHFVI